MSWITVVLPIVTLLVGALLTFLADSIRHARKRRESLSDGLRARRARTYVEFLSAAHGAAHLLGRMTPGCPYPLPDGSENYWLLDSDVVEKLRNVELVGSASVVKAAEDHRGALRSFRAAFDRGLVYDTPEYWSAYAPVRAARDAFIATARIELVSE